MTVVSRMERLDQTEMTPRTWTIVADANDRYSSGTPDLDRLLGGGFARGSMALWELGGEVSQADLDQVLFPTVLNFLYQSRGMIAVLPYWDTPATFRGRMTQYVTRRRFDSRVRIVTYVGETEGAPYVVRLGSTAGGPPGKRGRKAALGDMRKMTEAEKAAEGLRERSFLEVNAFEIADMLFGPDVATRMFFHGIKRARAVGNLVVGILRPEVRCAANVRRMADVLLRVDRDRSGLRLEGIRPAIPAHSIKSSSSARPLPVTLVPVES
jgi:hypothetical protein